MDRARLVEIMEISTPEVLLRSAPDSTLAALAESEARALVERAAALCLAAWPPPVDILDAPLPRFVGMAQEAFLSVLPS